MDWEMAPERREQCSQSFSFFRREFPLLLPVRLVDEIAQVPGGLFPSGHSRSGGGLSRYVRIKQGNLKKTSIGAHKLVLESRNGENKDFDHQSCRPRQ